MDKSKKSKKTVNYDAAANADELCGMNTASCSEATGMMYCPPRNADELESEEQLFSLQTKLPPKGYINGK